MNQTIQHFSCLFYQITLVRIILQFIIYNEKSTVINTKVKLTLFHLASSLNTFTSSDATFVSSLELTQTKLVFYKVLKLSNRCVFVFLILQNVTLLFFSNSTAKMIKRWFFRQWCRWLGINNKSAPNRSWTYDLLVTCVCEWKIIFLKFSAGSKFTITSLSLQYFFKWNKDKS